MVLKIDYDDGDVLRWELTADGVTCTRDESYTPTFYVEGGPNGDLDAIRERLERVPTVARTRTEEWRTVFRGDPEPVLRADVTEIDAVDELASFLRRRGGPDTYRCYNVDFSRAFRYCLETDGVAPPEPTDLPRDLTRLTISVDEPELATPPVTEITVGDETIGGDPEHVLETVHRRVQSTDPDALILDTARIVPALYDTAERFGTTFELGRRPGWVCRAGESTYEQYGKVGHSPARYSVPGRAIIDGSNTFVFAQTNLDGCLDLAKRSLKPLQEVAWASIGNVLTAIQCAEALDRGVLVPWRSWRHEFFKPMATLHDADRGGYTFAPEVGVHEDVHEIDFSSLYPNIICEENVSPDTIRCDCHAEREDVPGLGYAICDKEGYLPDVLQELVDDRDRMKRQLAVMDERGLDGDETLATSGGDCSRLNPEQVYEPTADRPTLQGTADAIKWILVSCFGYQGFNNAKFGRIECHEAINAFAREFLLDAKDALEAGGWRVLHGIVDSLWVTPAGEDPRPLEDLAAAISEDVGIRLEYEAAYDWLAFVPMRDSASGALTKYFGRRTDGTTKYRGVECRQRSTCTFVERTQRDLIDAVDETRDPAAVCDRLHEHVQRLERGEVDPEDLLIRNRATKEVDAYAHYTRTVAALERAEDLSLPNGPGRDVRYVVHDDDRRSRERVRLEHESIEAVDREFYRDRLLRAATSVLSPFGWHRGRIEDYLAERQDATLGAFS